MASSAIAASMMGKFGSAAAFMVIYQQAAELYPTSLRALGMGIGSVVSSLAVICMPYVCYLVSSFNFIFEKVEIKIQVTAHKHVTQGLVWSPKILKSPVL